MIYDPNAQLESLGQLYRAGWRIRCWDVAAIEIHMDRPNTDSMRRTILRDGTISDPSAADREVAE